MSIFSAIRMLFCKSSKFDCQKKAMSKFLFIPCEVWRICITCLLSVGDIVRLDSAILNHECRVVMQSNLVGTMIKTKLVVNDSKAQMMAWMSSRQIFPQKINFRGMIHADHFLFCTVFCAKAKALSFQGCRFFPDRELKEMLQSCCDYLEHFDLFDCTMSDLSNLPICSKLRRICLDGCNFIGGDSLKLSIASCPRLNNLVIHECKEIDEATIAGLMSECRALSSFEFHGTQDRPLQFLNIAQNMSKQVTITNLICGVKCIIDHSSLIRASAFLPLLKELTLMTGSDTVMDDAITALALNCPDLTSLHIYDYSRITSESLLSIAAHLPRIHSLAISYTRISDRGVVALAASCTALCSLNLRGCQRLTDNSIQAVLSRCTALVHLDVSFCRRLSDDAFSQITNTSALRSLSTVQTKLHGPYIGYILSTGVGLKILAISHISEEFTSLLEQHTNGIENLSVQGALLTHSQWLRLSVLFPQLRTLYIWDCQLDDDIIRSLVQHSSRLSSLFTPGCSGISEELYEEFPILCKHRK